MLAAKQLSLFQYESTPIQQYDQNKINLGNLMFKNPGGNEQEAWVGPTPIAIARPVEASTSIASGLPHVTKIDDDSYYVYLAEISTASATRRIVLYKYRKSTASFAWQGFVTINFPASGNFTIKGIRADILTYNTGTVSVSGTAVTGTSTFWNSVGKMSVGSRIGFGSTNPKLITTWYDISAIASDTSITLLQNVGTLSNQQYVIEETRVAISTTCSIATNGGLFLVKGLSPNTFMIGGTNIPAATTTDRIRACYWLADAATVKNITSAGCALDDAVSNSSRDCYVLDTTGPKIYKYNIRADLTLTAGKSTNTLLLVTGNNAVVGSIQSNNNGRVGTLYHGVAAGVKSFFFATSTRIVRANLANITSGNVNWVSDMLVEVPTGGPSTYATSSAMSNVEIMDTIDRLFVAGGINGHSYVTQYRVDSSQMDFTLFSDTKQVDQSGSNTNIMPYPGVSGTTSVVWCEDGIAFISKIGTNAQTCFLYAYPVAADWDFGASLNSRIVLPVMQTPDCQSFQKLCLIQDTTYGDYPYALSMDEVRVYARTSGISDNSGGWTLVNNVGDIGGFSGTQIQFMLEFRTLSVNAVPGRVRGLVLTYETNDVIQNFVASADFTVASAKQFAWRFKTAFGSVVPTLRVRIYDALTNNLLVDNNTLSNPSNFEKTTNDGVSWGAYNTADKGNETTYIRFTPTSLAAGIKVYARLTLNQGA